MDAAAQKEMNIYGYPESQELDSPLSMREVTIVASPQRLRLLASFLNHVADLMEKHGANFGHEHFSDFVKERVHPGASELIVSAPPSTKER